MRRKQENSEIKQLSFWLVESPPEKLKEKPFCGPIEATTLGGIKFEIYITGGVQFAWKSGWLTKDCPMCPLFIDKEQAKHIMDVVDNSGVFRSPKGSPYLAGICGFSMRPRIDRVDGKQMTCCKNPTLKEAQRIAASSSNGETENK